MENTESVAAVAQENSLLGAFNPEEIQKEPEDGQDIPVLTRGQDGKHTTVFEKPNNIPDEFWDQQAGSYRADEILKALEAEKEKSLGLRRVISKGLQNVPESADKYKVEGIEVEDEAEFNSLKEIAFKNKLTHEQFMGLVKDFNEVKSDPLEFSEEQMRTHFEEYTKKQNDEFFQKEMEKLGENRDALIGNLRSWGRELVLKGSMSEEDYKSFLNMPVTAEQVRVLNILREVSGFIGNMPTRDASLNGMKSKQEIDAIIASPEYQSGDPAKVREVEEWYRTMHR